MLTNGPLVGEAEADSVEQAILALEQAVKQGLGGKFTALHAEGIRKLAAALRAGERSWMSTGVWVTLEQ